VDYAKEKMGFYLSLATNATLLIEKMNKHPALRKLDFIIISLGGGKEINDRLRGENVFDRVVQALKMLKEYNIKTKISVVITKDNLGDYDYLINIAESYGTDIAFDPIAIHPQDKQLSARQYFPDKKTFQEFIDVLIKKKQDNSALASSLEYLRMVRSLWPDGANPIKCYAGKFSCDITPDGYVVPCCVRLDNVQDDGYGLKHGFKKAFFNLGDLTHCNLPCFCAGPQEINIALNMVPLKIRRIIKNYANLSII
jgi:MoaA/NifB/PqqE/SkfB family radical SAM enzyme